MAEKAGDRDRYWDSLKFVLIFLVIYGHVISGVSAFDRFDLAMYNFLYMFHMPLFIFISGRFSHIRDRKRYLFGILRIFETYVVFQVIRTLAQTLHGNRITAACLYTPSWIMWYLLALIYWRLLVCAVPERWLARRRTVLTVCFGISLLAGFIPVGDPITLQKGLAYLPLFALGYYSEDLRMRSRISRIPAAVAAAVLLSAFLIFFLVDRNFSAIHQCRVPYCIGSGPMLLKCAERGVYLAAAVLLSAMFMRIAHPVSIFAKWGSATMFFYLFQSFALREFLCPLIRAKRLPVHDVLLFVYSAALTAALAAASNFGVWKILLNPVTYWRRAADRRS